MDFSLKTICTNFAKAAPIALVSSGITTLVGRFGANTFSPLFTAPTAQISVLFSQFADSYFKNDVNAEDGAITKNRWKERLVSNFAIALTATAIGAKFVLKQAVLNYQGILVTSGVIIAVKYAMEALYKVIQEQYTAIKERREVARLLRNEQRMIEDLNEEVINALAPDQVAAWNILNIRHIPVNVIQHFGRDQIEAFTLPQLQSMTNAQANNFTDDQINWIPAAIWDELTPEQQNQFVQPAQEGGQLKVRQA